MIQTFWVEWVEWWAAIDPAFAFLMAMPFGIAAAALAADGIKNYLSRQETHSTPAKRHV